MKIKMCKKCDGKTDENVRCRKQMRFKNRSVVSRVTGGQET